MQDLVDAFVNVDDVPVTSFRRVSSSIQQMAEAQIKLEQLLLKFSQPNWSVKAFRMIGMDSLPKFRLKGYTSLHIAQQASCMQHYLHTKVHEDEILHGKYSEEDICPNICALRDWNINVMEMLCMRCISVTCVL